MSDVALQQVPGVYEPSLFGTYSKKIGMWLFLLSDSLTFGALLYAYTYGRISTPNWPTPFHSESIRNATFMTAFLLTSSLTMVFAVRSAVMGNQKAQRLWLFATMACGLGFVVLHGREWTNLIAEGLTLPVFPVPPGEAGNAEFVNVTGVWWHDRVSIRKAHAYGLERIFNASTLTVNEVRVRHLSDDVAIVHASMTLSGQTAIAAIRQPGTRRTIFSFVVHRVAGRWMCASAHNTDVVPNMETNVVGDDGTFRAANYRSGQVS